MNLRKEYSLFEKLKVWFGRRTVIVLTMGKVGTLSICNSVRKYGWRHVHPHSLFFSWPGIHFLKVNLTAFEKIYYAFKSISKRVKVFIWSQIVREVIIIAGVRDPFSRPISAFFEQIHYRGGLASEACLGSVIKTFEEISDMRATLDWFDSEIKRLTGINVYDYSFNHQKGFVVLEGGKYKIFIYRVDKLNNLEKEIGEFLDIDNFRIESVNKASEGDYPELSKSMMETYRYSESDVECFLRSKYLNHFYTKEEIHQLVNRWTLNV